MMCSSSLLLLHSAYRPASGTTAQYAAGHHLHYTACVLLIQQSRLHYNFDHSVHAQQCSLHAHPVLTTQVKQHSMLCKTCMLTACFTAGHCQRCSLSSGPAWSPATEAGSECLGLPPTLVWLQTSKIRVRYRTAWHGSQPLQTMLHQTGVAVMPHWHMCLTLLADEAKRLNTSSRILEYEQCWFAVSLFGSFVCNQ